MNEVTPVQATVNSVEVLIVGAGPVGLLTAVALAQSGVDVAVVEAEAKLNDSPRAAAWSISGA